jgi:hypothetical protein
MSKSYPVEPKITFVQEMQELRAVDSFILQDHKKIQQIFANRASTFPEANNNKVT